MLQSSTQKNIPFLYLQVSLENKNNGTANSICIAIRRDGSNYFLSVRTTRQRRVGGRDTDALHPRELADRTEQKTVQRGNLGDVSLLEIRLVSAVGIFLSIKKKR